MRNFKKKYFWVILVLFVWLIFANQIIVNVFLASSYRVKKINFDEVARKDTVYTIVSAETAIGDLFDKFSIKGGAFCAVEGEHSNRKVELILKSSKNAYQVEAVSEIRPDFYYTYSDKIKMHSNVGFQAMFSTLNLPDGIYDLYVEVAENDEVYGVGATGFRYIKDNMGFRPYEYGEVKKVSEAQKSDDIVFRVDSISFNNGTLNFGGWQLLKSSESALNDIYIEISDLTGIVKTLEVKKRIRTDIAWAYNSNDYLISGIYGEYHNINLDDGEYLLKIIVKENDSGKYYLSDEYEKIIIENGKIILNEHNK